MIKKLLLFFCHFLERPFKKGEIINDRYQVVNLLGAGGYGYSYLVTDTVNCQTKVLKALRLHKRTTKAGRKGFETEQNLLKSIGHPGFPKYFEGGTYKNTPYYTMEFINGKNFEQLIFFDGWKVSELDVLLIAEDLLEKIEYLHQQNIIHRDIRIPNVLYSDHRIRLIDLGLARYLYTGLNREKDIRKQVNVQADFYGLGHFLLFLLYSNFEVPDDKKEKSWEEELDICSETKQLIRRLLQIDHAYQNCAQIKTDLQKVIHLLRRKNNVVL
ncbi:serine/threonine protein kinase [Neobacillus dielmonensis]|uniref:serine/threonine protein kinase n=1 Tax=Neobacillus dielmonensis TaxID=1347369 RepID=UPI0005AB56A6|nr:protein kinase [Neobacillus dielmonensis]